MIVNKVHFYQELHFTITDHILEHVELDNGVSNWFEAYFLFISSVY